MRLSTDRRGARVRLFHFRDTHSAHSTTHRTDGLNLREQDRRASSPSSTAARERPTSCCTRHLFDGVGPATARCTAMEGFVA